MNEQTLAREFTAAVHPEPPLGFDPDEVVTRAGRRRRRRRNSLLTGAAVVAALAAVAITLTGPAAPAPVQPAGAQTVTPSDGHRWWPPGDIAQPTEARLRARAPEVADHLEAVLRTMVPPADQLRRRSNDSGRFGGVLPPSQVGVRTQEHGGPEDGGYFISVEVFVPAVPVTRFQPVQLCAELKKQISPETTCRYFEVGAGGARVVAETDTVDRANTRQHSISVTDFRADGTFVVATVFNSPGVEAPLPLTADQLTTVAGDPGLTL
ncbi:hypothetical protein ABJI51_25840 [Amycolatopsis sp. NEAU-NG30]|uniref:Uncharacterized protein n=1 Tax=Amycolatopsis melonis TaxID=3156488 RepID=A0ABV0LGY1_9PSEU